MLRLLSRSNLSKSILLLLVSIVIFSGCSKKLTSILNINNKTSFDSWVSINDGDWETIASNQGKSYSWQLKKTLSGLESRTLEVTYNGYTVFSKDTSINLKAGESKKIDIVPDGGCVSIKNDSQAFTITEVYISPSDSLYWGDDVLNGTIEPQDDVSWTVDPETWDIMVVDNYNDSLRTFNQEILLDSCYTYNYTGFEKSHSDNKKIGGKISAKIEKNCK